MAIDKHLAFCPFRFWFSMQICVETYLIADLSLQQLKPLHGASQDGGTKAMEYKSSEGGVDGPMLFGVNLKQC